MFKRNSVTATALSAFVFTTLCLLSSVPTTQAQVAPQEGAINTTRSNIKNTSRTGLSGLQGQLNGLRVEVAKYSGVQFGSGGQTQWKVYQINQMGDFNLGILPAGRYELRVTNSADANGLPDASRKQAADAATPPAEIELVLHGSRGGSIKRDVAVAPSSAGAAATTKLDGRVHTVQGSLNTVDADLSAKRPGPARYTQIVVESDGKTELKGGIVVKNITKPN